ncbi:MAG: DUF4114 domain-containing protein [Pseudomonadota bacterium]
MARCPRPFRCPFCRRRTDGFGSAACHACRGPLLGGYLYAPLLIADGDFESLEGDFKQVYFSFAQANLDGAEHIRSLGNNTFGFEDLPNGGDNDFNDLIIRTEITAV